MKRIILFITFLFIAAVAAYTFPSPQLPLTWNDSWFYAGPGATTLLRPWLTVGFWLTFGVSYAAIIALHLLSVACWSRLGWVSFGPLGVICALCIANHDLVRTWNFTVLSEPLAISGLAWLAAETVELRDKDTWYGRVLWCMAALLVTTRVATAILIIPAALAVVWKDKFYSRYWLVPFAVLAAAIPMVQQHHYPDHELQQARNIALFRVAEVPALEQWMVARGMPWPIPERWRRIQYPNPDDMRQTGARELADYIDRSFQKNYYLFLLTHPEYVLRDGLLKGATVPPATLYSQHLYPQVDTWLTTATSYVGYFVVMPLALLIEPWAGIILIIMPTMTYHININEFERMNALLWAWQCVTVLLMVRYGRKLLTERIFR